MFKDQAYEISNRAELDNSTAGSCMQRLWDVVQLLNPTNWKTSRGLIPVIVQAQRLKALPFSDIWDSTFYLCVPIYAHEEKLVHDIEVAFEALLNLSNWKTSQGLVKVLMQRAIPDIWQFWGATTQFRPVKGHQKVRKFVQKMAEMGKNLAFSMLKGAPTWKKYTTADSGGCD